MSQQDQGTVSSPDPTLPLLGVGSGLIFLTLMQNFITLNKVASISDC